MTFVCLDKSNAAAIAELEKTCFCEEAWSKKMIDESFGSGNTEFFGAFFDVSTDFQAQPNGDCRQESQKLAACAALIFCLDSCDLARICVEPSMQKKGIGFDLMKFCCEQAAKKGVKKVLLEVDSANKAALALYEKCGFKELSRRKNYYRYTQTGSSDALIMEKQL